MTKEVREFIMDLLVVGNLHPVSSRRAVCPGVNAKMQISIRTQDTGFSQCLQTNFRPVRYIRPRPLPFTQLLSITKTQAMMWVRCMRVDAAGLTTILIHTSISIPHGPSHTAELQQYNQVAVQTTLKHWFQYFDLFLSVLSDLVLFNSLIKLHNMRHDL
jgi:hypothetical protein